MSPEISDLKDKQKKLKAELSKLITNDEEIKNPVIRKLWKERENDFLKMFEKHDYYKGSEVYLTIHKELTNQSNFQRKENNGMYATKLNTRSLVAKLN